MSNYTDYLSLESPQYLRDFTENIKMLILVSITLLLLLCYGEKRQCDQILKEVLQRNEHLRQCRAKAAKFQSKRKRCRRA